MTNSVLKLVCALGFVAMMSPITGAWSAEKLPVAPGKVSAETMEMLEAFGIKKQFCCELKEGCISGPKNGSEACKKAGGKMFSNSVCVKSGKCMDP
jgi:hypothetical protein